MLHPVPCIRSLPKWVLSSASFVLVGRAWILFLILQVTQPYNVLPLSGVECVVFNDQYMTCMWHSKEKLTANYSLYYWYVPPR